MREGMPSEGTNQELHMELRDLSSRDLQLWSIVLLVLIVLSAGFLALVLPNRLWRNAPMQVSSQYLPQLFTGFITLLVLFNLYLLDQKNRLNRMREKFVRRVMDETSQNLAGMDPLTKSVSRLQLEQVLAREVSRANRLGTAISFLAVDLAGFRALNSRYGTLAGDHLLLVTAQMLKNNFRGSDTICRYGGDEFLVVMPDTAEEAASNPVRRLQKTIDAWNESTQLNYKLKVNFGLSSYRPGADPWKAVQQAMQRLGWEPGAAQAAEPASGPGCEAALRT
jgi:diguanylate cyclase (GGDEF)-like protein